jgi:hypothetical protein
MVSEKRQIKTVDRREASVSVKENDDEASVLVNENEDGANGMALKCPVEDFGAPKGRW